MVEVMGRALAPANAIQPVRVADAGWKANVVTGDAVDIRTLPIPIHTTGDGGPFITGGVTVSKDPVSGRGNLSYNRMQVKGPREFGFNLNEWRHVMQFLKNREALDQPLPVAIAIGLDPAITIAAGAATTATSCASRRDPRGGCQSLPRRHRGRGDPGRGRDRDRGLSAAARAPRRGQLAEFHGYFGEIWESPVFHVTAVCWHDNPIFQTIIPGWNEHVYVGNVLPREPLLLNFIRHVSKNVTGLHIPPYSSGFSAIVAINKTNPGEPKNVALAAMTAHVNIKWVIVVDSDVDIYDPADVLWALNTRVDWSRDIFLVPGSQGHEMDPTADRAGCMLRSALTRPSTKVAANMPAACGMGMWTWESTWVEARACSAEFRPPSGRDAVEARPRAMCDDRALRLRPAMLRKIAGLRSGRFVVVGKRRYELTNRRRCGLDDGCGLDHPPAGLAVGGGGAHRRCGGRRSA